jgi:FAD/FMN-containing dehydrogenase
METPSLRAATPWRVLDGFGGAVRAACRYAAPRGVEELARLLLRASEENLPVAFRGSGLSYGDASLNGRGLVIDTSAINRVLGWDPAQGVLEVEPGVTMEGVWRRTLEDGYWPPVVPGTMYVTMAGCLAMNIHGKNNFREGPFGEHVLDFDLLTPAGDFLRCSRTENADVFHAGIGGAGLLGAITRARLRLKRVESGMLRVEPIVARSFGEMIDLFEARLGRADYLVGWVDCFSRGGELGRGIIHQANYLLASEESQPGSLHVEHQGLPSRILGISRRYVWRLMRPWMRPSGVRILNFAKFNASRLRGSGSSYVQSLVAFSFLLDYILNWRRAYGPGGFIQFQLFVPAGVVRSLIPELLRMCQDRRMISYLGVLKRHRPDEFLLSHALDGYSLAMDFPVDARQPERLWAFAREMTARVLEAGGNFYLAKDAVLTSEDARKMYGERLTQFFQLKHRLDPAGLLCSDLARRVFPRGANS